MILSFRFNLRGILIDSSGKNNLLSSALDKTIGFRTEPNSYASTKALFF